jgi:hypothetical protein
MERIHVENELSRALNNELGELTPQEHQEENTQSLLSSIVSNLQSFFQGILDKASDAWHWLSDIKTFFYFSVSSALSSALMSMITLLTGEHSSITKAALIGTLTLNLVTIIQATSLVVERGSMDIQFDTAKATSTFTNLMEASINGLQNTEDGFTEANAMGGIIEWTKLGVSALVCAVIAGMGLFGLTSWHEIRTGTSIIDGLKKTWATVGDVTKYILTEVIGITEEKDLLIVEEMEALASRLAELTVMDQTQFVMNDDLYLELTSAEKKVRVLTSRPKSADASKRLQTVTKLIQEHVSRLNGMIRTVNDIRAQAKRQAPVGIVLSGAHGIGKSTWAEDMMFNLAPKLGYNNRIYNMSKPDNGFWIPYGGESCGIYNEFMSRREDDPVLPDINNMFSEDPHNFESAHLEGKVQPNRLKLACLTVNDINPNFKSVLSDGAARATWDRLIHIHVEDPEFKGRQYKSTHRKDDFSHLRFTRVWHPPSQEHGEELICTPISHEELNKLILGRMAEAEMRYNTFLMRECDKDPEKYIDSKEKIKQRTKILQDIFDKNDPYKASIPPDWNACRIEFTQANMLDMSGGRDFFVWRFQGPIGSGKSTIADSISKFCSKTFNLPYNRIKSFSKFKPNPNEPEIYHFEDAIKPEVYSEYMEGINQTHPLSIIIISDNFTFKRQVRTWREWCVYKTQRALYINTATPWEGRDFDGPEGCLRRLGLEGYILTKTGMCNTGNFYTRTFTSELGYIVRKTYENEIIDYETIESDCFDAYRKFVKHQKGVCIINEPAPIMPNPGIHIRAKSENDLARVLQSKVALMKAFSGVDSAVSIHITPNAENASGQTSLKQWVLPETQLETEGQKIALIQRLFGALNRLIPGVELKVDINQGEVIYALKDGTGYYYRPAEQGLSYKVVYSKEGHARFCWAGRIIDVSASDFANAMVYNRFENDLLHVPKDVYADLVRKFMGEDPTHDPDPIFKTAFLLAKSKAEVKINASSHVMYARLLNNPIIQTIGAIIIGLGSACIIYKLAKILIGWFRATKKPSPQERLEEAENLWWDAFCDTIAPNYGTNSDEELDSNPVQKKQSKIFKQEKGWKLRSNYGTSSDEDLDSSPIQKKQSKIFKQDKNWRLRANEYQGKSKFTKIQANTFSERKQKILKTENPEELYSLVRHGVEKGELLADKVAETISLNEKSLDTFANMLRREAEVPTQATQIDSMVERLNKVYYTIASDAGSNYAIAIGGKLLLTTAHTIPDETKQYDIFDGRTHYKSKVVFLNRERELAVVEVLDKSFTQQKSIAKWFADDEDFADVPYAFFVRPLEGQSQIMGSYITYHPHLRRPLRAFNSEVFNLSSQCISFTVFSDGDLVELIHKGDCGFPLIAKINNTYKIIGIHNAFTKVENTAWFSGVSKADIEQIIQESCGLSTLATANTLDKPDGKSETELVEFYADPLPYVFYTQREYVEALEDLKPSKFGDYSETINLYGYSRNLNFTSHPKPKRKNIQPNNSNFEPMVLPSAITLDDVTDTSKLAVDKMGKPDTLFTQLVKYGKGRPASYDPKIFDHVTELKIQEYKNAYGDQNREFRKFEVINGAVGNGSKPLTMKTAAGPFMKLKYKINNKADLFDLETDGKGIDYLKPKSTPAAIEMMEQYRAILSCWKRGDPYLFVSKDCAKVELLPAEKVREGKVRLFNEVDLSFNMALKKIFGGLLQQIMLNHTEHPIKLGQNPYSHASRMMRDFDEIDGDIISTDYSAFDKTIHADLIQVAMYICSKLIKLKDKDVDKDAMFSAIADSLTYTLHTCNGHIVMVEGGNESGTFVTTLLNSIVVDFIDTYSFCVAFQKRYNYLPSLTEFTSNTRRAIFGDDMARKVSYTVPIDFNDIKAVAEGFGMKCTAAKGPGGLHAFDFCSRTMYKDEVMGVTFPALKLCSIVGAVHYVTTRTKQDVLVNCNVALLEAAFHSREIYDKVEKEVLLVLANFKIKPEQLESQGYNLIRKRFQEYVLQGGDLPALTLAYECESGPSELFYLENHKTVLKTSKLKERSIVDRVRDPDIQLLLNNPAMQAKQKLYELFARLKEESLPVETICKAGPDHEPTFSVVVTYRHLVVTKSGKSKKEALKQAYEELLPSVIELLTTQSNMDTCGAIDLGATIKPYKRNQRESWDFKRRTVLDTLEDYEPIIRELIAKCSEWDHNLNPATEIVVWYGSQPFDFLWKDSNCGYAEGLNAMLKLRPLSYDNNESLKWETYKEELLQRPQFVWNAQWGYIEYVRRLGDSSIPEIHPRNYFMALREARLCYERQFDTLPILNIYGLHPDMASETSQWTIGLKHATCIRGNHITYFDGHLWGEKYFDISPAFEMRKLKELFEHDPSGDVLGYKSYKFKRNTIVDNFEILGTCCPPFSLLKPTIAVTAGVANTQLDGLTAINRMVSSTVNDSVYRAFTFSAIQQQVHLAKSLSRELHASVALYSKRYPKGLRTRIHPELGIRYQFDDSKGVAYLRSSAADIIAYDELAPVYRSVRGVSESGSTMWVLTAINLVRANAKDGGIETSPVSDVNANPGMSTIPQLSNPIPTQVQPAMADNQPAVVAAQEIAPTQDLVPIGPPNLIKFGAIGFDLKDLVYSQFLDSNVQYEYTDDHQEGTILFQIPYDPLSPYCNPFIRSYVQQHERYAGSLQFRVTIIGNATYSGLIGVSWMPYRIKTPRVNMAEVQKFSYYAESITLPSNRVLSLHDARQDLFYRTIHDKADIDRRPHLVCYVMTSAQSSLRTGIKIRIRLASKLSNGSDGGEPFQVSNPLLGVQPGPGPDPSNPLVGKNLKFLYPIGDHKFTIDGTQIMPKLEHYVSSRFLKGAFRQFSTNPVISSSQFRDAQYNGLPTQFVITTSLVDKPFTDTSLRFIDVTEAKFTMINIDGSNYNQTQNFIAEVMAIVMKDVTTTPTTPYAFDYDTFNRALHDVVSGGTLPFYAGYFTVLEDASSIPLWPLGSIKGWSLGAQKQQAIVLIGEQGTIVISVIHGTATGRQASWFPGGVGIDTGSQPKFDKTVSEIMKVNTPPKYLPSGWANLLLSEDDFLITPGSNRLITSLQTSDFLRALQNNAGDVPEGRVIQIKLNDVDSNLVTIVARYDPKLGTFMVNLGSTDSPAIYSVYGRDLSTLYISEISIQEATAVFPPIDASSWLSRTVGPTTATYANMMAVAGGALSGIGGGLGAWQQHNWNLEMQGNMFQNQKEMQKFWAEHQKEFQQMLYEQGLGAASYQQQLAGYRTPAMARQVINQDTSTQTPRDKPSSDISSVATEPIGNRNHGDELDRAIRAATPFLDHSAQVMGDLPNGNMPAPPVPPRGAEATFHDKLSAPSFSQPRDTEYRVPRALGGAAKGPQIPMISDQKLAAAHQGRQPAQKTSQPVKTNPLRMQNL